MRRLLFVTIIGFIFCGCGNQIDDSQYFNGVIESTRGIPSVSKLNACIVEINGTVHGDPSVFDSILIFWSPYFPDAFFSVYDMKNDRHLGYFCNKGRGPRESLGLTSVYQLYEEGGDIKSLFYAPNEKREMIWNISKSIEQGVTVFDTIVTVENGPGLGNYSYVYSLPNHEYIGCLPAMYTTIELDKATVPTLERRDLYSNELIASYNPFKEAFVKENDKVIGVERYFSAGSCVKPDGSKIAQSMIYLDQINIIDVESGEIRGFRVEGSPDFSVFRKAPDIKWYHFDIQCDDRYIYSLYSGEKYESDQKKVVLPHLVHVYDWEGNFVRKLDLGQGVARIWIDPANTNLLYTMNYNTETLCRYDLNQMQ